MGPKLPGKKYLGSKGLCFPHENEIRKSPILTQLKMSKIPVVWQERRKYPKKHEEFRPQTLHIGLGM